MAVELQGALRAADQANVAGGGVATQPVNTGTGGVESVMWQASIDDSGGDRAATLQVSTSADGANCRISAQGMSTS